MRKIFFILIILAIKAFAQTDSVEVYLIDSYVSADSSKYILSFYTSLPAKSRMVLDNNYRVDVSKELSENHKIDVDISKMKFKNKIIPFYIEVEDSTGNKSMSELYEFELPVEIVYEDESNFFQLCLFGGTVFMLPYPTMNFTKEKSYFGITKEIPLVFLKSTDIGYPKGYFSIEYSHIFKGERNKNLMRLGYKHIIDLPVIEYVSPGISGFTNFKGYNGISPELSVGFFRLWNVFTVYGKYRYNAKPGEAGTEFQEITLGLYSGFFALYF